MIACGENTENQLIAFLGLMASVPNDASKMRSVSYCQISVFRQRCRSVDRLRNDRRKYRKRKGTLVLLSNRKVQSSPMLLVGIVLMLVSAKTHAQPNAIDNELQQFKGHWRVVEMIENGKAIPQDQMRQWLPGGGVLEIVDYTILFKSPIDGSKSTKSFRLDPATYPKQIAILERDTTTGTGIYKFDQGKLVLCITNEARNVPVEFSAHADSNRTLVVLARFEPGSSEIPGLNAKLAQRKPVELPASRPSSDNPVETSSSVPTASARTAPASTPIPSAQSTPPAIVVESVAGRLLTDSEVRKMALGTWRMNDNEGSVDIVFDPSGGFRTYRYHRTLSNFQYVFVPTPVSTGTWTITNGRLIAKVASSTRFDRVNQSFVPAVRSISATDMILVDHLGRVSRAVRSR